MSHITRLPVHGPEDTKDEEMGRFVLRKAGNINVFLGLMQTFFLHIGASQPTRQYYDIDITRISPIASE